MEASVSGTVAEALAAATAALAAAGVESPRLDAEILLAEALGVDRARLAAEPEAGVRPALARNFGDMVRRRVSREPVAYILGRKAFRHLELVVDPRALIPRPETELLVEIAIELAAEAGEADGSGPEGAFRILDVGTGSGAVALAIADELPGAAVVACERSRTAIEVARENVARRGIDVRLVLGSLPVDERFDLVVANLPYVSDAEWETLEPEIVRCEPREAVVAGPTGLEAIEWLLGALAIDQPGSAAVALEVGAGQATAVAELVRRTGYESVEARPDLAGIERVVVGRNGA